MFYKCFYCICLNLVNAAGAASLMEVHSAIARLHRLGKLNDVGNKGALARLDLLSRGWREILPGDSLRELAMRLLNAYELRSADSVQLAAALTWCQHRAARRVFVCADQRPSNAAKSEGFSVLEL
jgi:predicted nucleic acid-binding protein